MLDIRLIRDNSKAVEENLLRRGDKDKVRLLYDLIRLDSDRRKAIQDVEKLKHMKNNITKDISELKSKGKPVKAKLKEVKELPNRIKKLDGKLSGLDKKCHSILMTLPNMLHESVPQGKDDSDNAELRRWGQQPKFNFTPKGHMEILQQLDMIDFERAAKVSGAGFYYLKGDAVILDMSLQRFALDMLRKRGFVVVEPPLMINRKAYEGMMDAADFEMVTYKIENENLYLIATAEHPIGSSLMDETLNRTALPLKFAGIGEKLSGIEEFHPERMASRILGMGDILGLVEDAQRGVDQDKAQAFARKMKSGKGFDLNDFREQIGQMRKMGGMSSMLEKLPAQFAQAAQQAGGSVDDKSIRRIEGIISSMTALERTKPEILKASRKRRIATGAGVSVQEVNRLLKQFEQTQKMMKQFSKGGMHKLMRGMQSMLPGMR